jgi:hypothetical protein
MQSLKLHTKPRFANWQAGTIAGTQAVLGLLLLGCADYTPTLDVSAARGRIGLALTNRSPDRVTDCTVTLLERGRSDEWIAQIAQLAPADTYTVRWSAFTSRTGQPMPVYLGPAAKHFTVACFGPDKSSRSAGLTFS